MKVIGLCGGSGSGKGTVGLVFSKYNIPSIDTDLVYRELTCKGGECLDALALEFGDGIIGEGGGLDRKRLASIVFGAKDSEARLARLNEITHKYILDEVRQRLGKFSDAGYTAAIVDAPVLFESGFDKECDHIVCVLADEDIRVDRIIRRDGITPDQARARIASQISNELLASRCDSIIYNNGSIYELDDQVLSLITKITN